MCKSPINSPPLRVGYDYQQSKTKKNRIHFFFPLFFGILFFCHIIRVLVPQQCLKMISYGRANTKVSRRKYIGCISKAQLCFLVSRFPPAPIPTTLSVLRLWSMAHCYLLLLLLLQVVYDPTHVSHRETLLDTVGGNHHCWTHCNHCETHGNHGETRRHPFIVRHDRNPCGTHGGALQDTYTANIAGHTG